MRGTDPGALALVHSDGHVLNIGINGQPGSRLAVYAAMCLLSELAVAGPYALEEMTLAEAVARHVAAQPCAKCAPLLGCGCPVILAVQGGCPHGGREKVEAAMDRMGLAR